MTRKRDRKGVREGKTEGREAEGRGGEGRGGKGRGREGKGRETEKSPLELRIPASSFITEDLGVMNPNVLSSQNMH